MLGKFQMISQEMNGKLNSLILCVVLKYSASSKLDKNNYLKVHIYNFILIEGDKFLF